jgi:hypothetical protein
VGPAFRGGTTGTADIVQGEHCGRMVEFMDYELLDDSNLKICVERECSCLPFRCLRISCKQESYLISMGYMVAVSRNEMYLRYLNVTTMRTKVKVCCLTKESCPVYFPICDSRKQPARDH